MWTFIEILYRKASAFYILDVMLLWKKYAELWLIFFYRSMTYIPGKKVYFKVFFYKYIIV